MLISASRRVASVWRPAVLGACVGMLARSPQAMQLRYLRTLAGIAGDKTNTIVFPMPGDFIDLLRAKLP